MSNLENHVALSAEQNRENVSSTASRVKLGWQCPECFGVRISTRRSKYSASIEGFLCVECGCQFGARND